MKARIYQPARTAMQSGQANTREWALEFVPFAAPFIDPLMGWTGMKDTRQELQLRFDSQEEAVAYAKRKGLEIELTEPHTRITRPKSYAANFAYNKTS